VENVGVEIAAPECKSGNRRRKKSIESEGFKNVFLMVPWSKRRRTKTEKVKTATPKRRQSQMATD